MSAPSKSILAPSQSPPPAKPDNSSSSSSRTKPNLKIGQLPPFVQPHKSQSKMPATHSESILVTDKLSIEDKTRPPTHHKQPSVHAHFLVNDVVGHTGPRSRSGSTSDKGSGSDQTESIRPGMLKNEIRNDDTFLNHKSDLEVPAGPSKTAAAAAASASASASASQLVSAGDPRLPQNDGKIHILLGATGSVSTGKLRKIILKLEEIYTKPKVSIQLILTKAAEKFVSRGEIPSNVRIWRDHDEWDTWRSRTDPVVHIELRRWADIFVIAPLSANTLGKISLGLCDNLLTNVIRAWNTQYPILIAPAMSSYAYNHPATKRHLKVIKEDMKWFEILKPVEKVVGSYGDIGMGGMMDWNEIVDKIVVKLGGYPKNVDDEEEEDEDDERSGNKEDEDEYDEDEDEDEVEEPIDVKDEDRRSESRLSV
jgi:hypothetical protein